MYVQPCPHGRVALYVIAIHVGKGVTQICPPHDWYTKTGEGEGWRKWHKCPPPFVIELHWPMRGEGEGWGNHKSAPLMIGWYGERYMPLILFALEPLWAERAKFSLVVAIFPTGTEPSKLPLPPSLPHWIQKLIMLCLRKHDLSYHNTVCMFIRG